jgi:hypothetical protein
MCSLFIHTDEGGVIPGLTDWGVGAVGCIGYTGCWDLGIDFSDYVFSFCCKCPCDLCVCIGIMVDTVGNFFVLYYIFALL